mmetsp:Transcript_13163/g.33390  ORF Transcript_13163/g.33390 Transcript_13163/m.33390 type:complete len:190 (-) Transcript_13163:198-767(-)
MHSTGIVRSNAIYQGVLETINSSASDPGVIERREIDVSFPALGERAFEIVADVAKLPQNADVKVNGGRFTGTNAWLNVFRVDYVNHLSSIVVEVPSGSAVVINIGGENALLENFEMMRTPSCTSDSTMLNFFEASQLSLRNTSISAIVMTEGRAHMVDSRLEGRLVCGSFHALDSAVFASDFAGSLLRM